METRGATSAHHRRPAVERRFKSGCAAQPLPARLRNDCFEIAVLKEVLETPEARQCSSVRRWISAFPPRGRCISILAVPKNETSRE
jgi:hypothetical protein